jgi:lysophospholipase L1-like esterase
LANGSPTRYYVALGDSLATGGGATPGDGYVDDVFAFAKRSIPGLSLENLACAGDSTTRMINGGLCHNYTTGNQLGDAKAFLSTHRRQVAFVTIDIGGDDITCFSGESLDVPCFEAGLQRVKTNLWQILAQLRSAGGSVPFLGMTYYDPYLAFWLQGGAAGHAAARQSLRLVKRFNRALQRIYRRYGLRVVDGQAAFHTSDFKRDGSFDGQALPLNVDRICQWTHMCSFGTNIAEALMHNGRHANDTGHGVLASAFDRVLATPPRPSENQPAALGL